MPWPVPQPTDISSRAAAVYAATYPDFNPTAPNTVAGTTCRIIGMTGFDLYLHQSYLAGELFPDTAIDNLDRHAGIWGITRLPGQAATGSAQIAVLGSTTIPIGTVLTDQLGNAYVTTSGKRIYTTGPVSSTLQIAAVSPGAQGNLAAGTVLQFLSPVPNVSPQSATVLAPGLSGGAPAESDDALRARLLARIRSRGRGGSLADYQQWAKAASSVVEYVQVVPNWVGLGSVGVFVAGAGPSALTSDEVTTVDTYLQSVRPVTARVITQAAATQAINVTLHLVPDTAANRVAAQSGYASWVASSAQIGSTAYVDDLAAAIKATGGSAFSFDILSPAADVVLGNGTIAVAGTVSFA
jgi:uncharacterized phage protein gp47/JayE